MYTNEFAVNLNFFTINTHVHHVIVVKFFKIQIEKKNIFTHGGLVHVLSR